MEGAIRGKYNSAVGHFFHIIGYSVNAYAYKKLHKIIKLECSVGVFLIEPLQMMEYILD